MIFEDFGNARGQFISNRPPKHMITRYENELIKSEEYCDISFELLAKISQKLNLIRNKPTISPTTTNSNHDTSIKRSRHRRCSVRKGVCRNLSKFTRKHLW